MKEEMKVSSCSVRANGAQDIRYENPEFPVYLQKIKYTYENRFSVIDHWHDELEFVYCIDGSVNYMVEGKHLLLKKGDGIFVNSRKLHVVSHIQEHESEFYCIIFHPLLLSASRFVDAKYIEPILKNPGLPYLLLKSDIDWQKEILLYLEDMYNSLSKRSAALNIQIDLFNLWKLLYEHLDLTEKEHVHQNHNLSILKDMILYIQRHYQEKLSLEAIASSGKVGKTMCIGIFNNYLNKTPGEFLKEYRIQQSIELLKNTDMSVTEISYEAGFSGASYYTKMFRESTGLTPLEYRKRHN